MWYLWSVQIPDSPALPMSGRAYAKRRGVSAMTVSNAIKSGRLVKCIVRDAYGNPKIADPDLADQEWEANTDHTDSPQHAVTMRPVAPLILAHSGPGADAPSLSEASARAKHYEAELKKLKYEREAGELVEACEVEQRVADAFTECKTKLLGIPTRLRQADSTLTEVQLGLVKSVIREALLNLSEVAGDAE